MDRKLGTRQIGHKTEGKLYMNKDGTAACKRREEDKVLFKYNAIVLPHFYRTELLFRRSIKKDLETL